MTADSALVPSTELPKVLVVDDEKGYREGIRRILERRGYEAHTAESGAQAIELVCAEGYPLVLVDLKMPEVDGFQVIEVLRRRRPATLCIVVSAFATIESAVQTTKMGAFDFVVKPFVPEDLMRVVQRASDAWRLAQESERLRVEREAHLFELAAEKSRLRTIVQSMGEGLLVVNINGDVVLDNPAARRLLRRVGPAITGPIAYLLPDDKFLGTIGQLIDGDRPEFAPALELRLPAMGDSSQERYLRATLAPIVDEKGAGLGAVVVLSDITDEKAFEQMKTLFVSMVAHELKAPIGAVEGYLTMIQSGALENNKAQLEQIIDRCLRRTGSLLTLIQDLTEITRRDAGRHERQAQALNLSQIVDSLVEFHQHEASEKGVSLEVVDPQKPLTLSADRTDLETILTNLLSNAIKYNRKGGKATVRLSRTAGMLTLEVQDTGIGMTEAERSRLGEEFYRVKNAKTRTITGTGLGIALVKKIVESYNGALQVESVPDQGSTFRVLLPLAASSS